MKILILMMILISLTGYAGLSEDMNDFFNASGYQSNVSGPGAYHGQTAGLYTGGQLYARNQVKMIYPASIQLPAFSAGCGGIDAFTGAFSFISGDELTKSLKSIASSAGSYAFMLGMETVSPQISGIQKHLSNLANAVNRSNINSCETASSLVGGIWPKTEVAQNHICTSVGAGGKLSDWAAAKQGCASGKTASTLRDAPSKYKSMIVANTNLAWELIKDVNFFSSTNAEIDNEMKELLMSVSGTVIIKSGKDDDEPNNIRYVGTMIYDSNFIKALLYGGQTVNILRCDESKLCLDPVIKTTDIAKDRGFVRMTATMLAGIRQKVENDSELSQEEINFLNTTTLPLYKMFNVEYAAGKRASILNIDSYAELIAMDLLYQYLTENLEVMRAASYSKDFQREYLDEFRSMLEGTRQQLSTLRNVSNKKRNETDSLIKQTQLLEQALAARLSSHLISVIGYENGV